MYPVKLSDLPTLPAAGTGVGMPWAVVAEVVGGCTRVPTVAVVWNWPGIGVRGVEVEATDGITDTSTTRGAVAPVVTVVAAEEPVVVVVEDEGVAMFCSSRAGRIR